jgi:hypothetical protein
MITSPSAGMQGEAPLDGFTFSHAVELLSRLREPHLRRGAVLHEPEQ